MCSNSIPDQSQIFKSAGKKATPVESFQFGRHEIPVRLAHIIREIDLLPKNLLKMPSVELVRSWYVAHYQENLSPHDILYVYFYHDDFRADGQDYHPICG